MKAIMLQSNNVPPYLLNWELKKDFNANKISYRPCLKHLSIALGKCAVNLVCIYSINDIKKFTFKKEINNIILMFKSAQTKNAFYFFPITFLGTSQL